MRLTMSVLKLLTPLVIGLTCSGQVLANLIVNSGLEEGAKGWKFQSPAISRSTAGAYAGKACLKISVTNAVHLDLAVIKVKPRTIHRLGWQYRFAGQEPRSSCADKVVVQDKATKKILSQWWLAWQQAYAPFEFYFNSGTSEEVEVLLYFAKDTDRQVYLDEFSLEETPRYLPLTQEFESNSLSAAPFCFLLRQREWYKEATKDFFGPYGKEQTQAAGIKMAVDEKVTHAGARSLKIAKPQITDTIFQLHNAPLPVQPGHDYEISFYLRGTNPKSPVNLWIQGNVIHPPEKNQRKSFYFTPEPSWQECKVHVRVPAEGQEGYVAEPYLQVEFQLLPEMTGTCWLDDITIKEVSVAQETAQNGFREWGYFRSFYVLPEQAGKTNLALNSSFECGRANWYDALFSGYQGISIVREAAHGNYSLRLDFRPPQSGYVGYRGTAGVYDGAKNRFRLGAVVSSYKIPIQPDKSYTLSFQAKADEDGREIFVGVIGVAPGKWIDKSGITANLSKDWKRYATVVKPLSRAVNLAVNFPQYDGKPLEGVVWLDAIQLEEGAKATDYNPRYPVEIGLLPVKYGNVFQPGEPVECLLTAANHDAEPRNVKVAFTITDFAESQQSFTREINVPARMTLEQKIALPLTNIGFYSVYARAASGKDEAEAGTKLAIIQPVEAADPYFALCANSWCSLEGLRLWLPLARLAGIHTVRVFMSYFCINHPDYEGELYFTGYDSGLDEFRKYGFEVMPTLCCGLNDRLLATLSNSRNEQMPWRPDAKRKGDWRDFLAYAEKTSAEIARHYRGRINHFEVWNEPNCRGPTPANFNEYEQTTARGLRTGNPDVKVVGPCATGEDWKFAEGVGNAGGFKDLDVLSHHFYGLNSDMEPIAQGLHRIAKKYGKPDMPIWNTELNGTPIAVDESRPYIHERRQAAEMVKTMTAGKAYGVDKYFYFHADELDAWPWRGPISQGLFDFGAAQMTPTLRYPTYAALAGFLGKAEFLKEYKWSEDHVGYLFKGQDGLPVAVIFSWPELPTRAELSLALPDNSYRLFNIDGSACSGRPAGIIPVTATPLFIKAATVQEKEFMAAFDQAVFSGLSVAIANFTLAGRETACVELENKSRAEARGKVFARECGLGKISDEKEVLLKPFETQKIAMALPRNRLRFGLDWQYQAVLQLDKDIVTRYKIVRNLTPCPPAGPEVKIDGRLDEWPDAGGLPADKKEQAEIFQGTQWSGPEDLCAVFYVLWDQDNLYVAAKVTDDKFCQKEAVKSWLGDSVQFAFDLRHDGMRQRQGEEKNPNLGALERSRGDNRVLSLSLYEDRPRVEWTRFTDTAGTVVDNNPAGLQAAIKVAGRTAIYEARIPKELLMGEQLRSGTIMGFLAMVNDNDGKGRKSQLQAPYYIPSWPGNWNEFAGLMLVTADDLKQAKVWDMVEQNVLGQCRLGKSIDKDLWQGLELVPEAETDLDRLFFGGARFVTNVMQSATINVYGYQVQKDTLLIVCGNAQRQARIMLGESVMKRADLACTLDSLPVEISKDSIPVNAVPYVVRIKECQPDEVKILHVGGYGEAFD